MGKKGGASWFTAVKRAFRSPTKESPDKSTRNCRRKEDQHQHTSSEDHDDDKKKEKRRWLFKKSTAQQEVSQQSPIGGDLAEQRHAMATAQAAMEVGRLASPGVDHNNNSNIREHNNAAIVIQTAFRGYLARRALRALKGLVKLQALVRGQNVRRQAKMTLKCMQALVRVQARVVNQRMSLSHEGSRKSILSDTNSLLESRYLQDVADRTSLSHSRGPSSIADDWDERPHTIEEVKAMLLSRQEAAFKREKNLSLAVSHQMWRSDRSSVEEEELVKEKPRWMAYKTWGSTPGRTRARASTDHRDNIKTVEIDTCQPLSYSAPTARRSVTMSSNRPPSPLHGRASHSHSHSHSHSRSQSYYHQHPPPTTTPSPSRARPIQVRTASPQYCFREDTSYTSSISQTPSLRSNHYHNANVNPSARGASSSVTHIPNYMVATESAKARLRSQSAPRQRPSTPERDRDRGSAAGAKKRLSFPTPVDPYSGMGYANYNLKSPSFKSVIQQHSNYSSYCTESNAGEISPSSTTDLRRWLR